MCGEALAQPPLPEDEPDPYNKLRPGWTDEALRTPKQGHGVFVRQESNSHSGQRVRCSDPMERLFYSSTAFQDSDKVCTFCAAADAAVDAERKRSRWFCPFAPPAWRMGASRSPSPPPTT